MGYAEPSRDQGVGLSFGNPNAIHFVTISVGIEKENAPIAPDSPRSEKRKFN